MLFSALQLNLPDAAGASIRELTNQQQQFNVCHEGIDSDAKVEVYKCIIGQDRKLIHAGDYVKLSSDHHEVITQVHSSKGCLALQRAKGYTG